MNLALQEARKILGNTKENPAVGCVLVKNNIIISAGYTSINGRPHAEQNAINFSKQSVKNSHLYVTLEPCSHYGKTPPCVNAIIRNKVKKVFFSVKDPDYRSYDKSTQLLRNKGISVSVGLLSKKIELFYKSYFKSKKTFLPYVTCKLAISRDFFTINKSKKKWITNRFSRGRVHLMRSNHDCVITSSNTAIKDNPRLSCRINGLESRSPSKIILDNKLKIKINSNIVKEAKIYNTIIFYNKSNKKKINLLKKMNIKIYKIPLNDEGNIDLVKSLKKAKKLGFSRIFLESGVNLVKGFLENNLVDDLKIFISNHSLNAKGDSNIKNYLKNYLKNKKKIVERVNLMGDKLITYKLK